MIISADTMVVLNYYNHNKNNNNNNNQQQQEEQQQYEIIGKPLDADDAKKTLLKISSHGMHHIITGVCCLFPIYDEDYNEINNIIQNTINNYNSIIRSSIYTINTIYITTI
eukprot:UN10467